MITPTTRCGGLAVTGKQRDRFVVEELGDGSDGEVGFDWLLIAPRRAALGASHAAGLPDALPEAKAATSPA